MARDKGSPARVTHQLDIYGAWLHVTRSRKAWRVMRKDLGLDIPKRIESLGLTSRVHERDGTIHLCVFLDKRLDGAELVETISHEAAHLAGMLFDSISEKYDGESESFAYLVGWSAAWMWQATKELA